MTGETLGDKEPGSKSCTKDAMSQIRKNPKMKNSMQPPSKAVKQRNNLHFRNERGRGSGRLVVTRPIRQNSVHAIRNDSGSCKRRPSESGSMPLRKRHRGVGQRIAIAGDPMVLPHKFHLGGNINDPLNLNELINRQGNITPPSDSPIRSPIKADALVLRLPSNPKDPLNLNVPDKDITADEMLLPLEEDINVKAKAKKKDKWKSRNPVVAVSNGAIPNCEGTVEVTVTKKQDTEAETEVKVVEEICEVDPGNSETPLIPIVPAKFKKVKPAPNLNKIVSPAIRQGKLPRLGSQTGNQHHPLGRKKSGKISAKSESQTGASASESEVVDAGQGYSNLSTNKKRQKRKRRLSSKSSATKSSADSEELRRLNLATTDPTVASAPSISVNKNFKEARSKTDKMCDHGNYDRYYGKRNQEGVSDSRLDLLESEWFRGKEVLDIGCNVGHFTLTLARDFGPERITGIDVDGELIAASRRNIRHYLVERSNKQSGKFGSAFARLYGPLARDFTETNGNNSNIGEIINQPRENPENKEVSKEVSEKVTNEAAKPKNSLEMPAAEIPSFSKTSPPRTLFPKNVIFKQTDFVLESDALLETVMPEYDVVLALSVSKWVHLNGGDDAIKRFFKRVYRSLRPGGMFILEAQPWQSYKRRKKLTPKIWDNFQKIQFKPDRFRSYLLSSEVGFESVRYLGNCKNKNKGFQRSVVLFVKGS